MENERLRMELLKLTGKAGSISSSKPGTPSQQHMAMSDNSGKPTALCYCSSLSQVVGVVPWCLEEPERRGAVQRVSCWADPGLLSLKADSCCRGSY